MLTYEAILKPASELPGGRFTVTNTAYLDADQIPPLVATAQIDVWGDITPPVTTSSATPPPNTVGWNNAEVQVLLQATDEAVGSGVREIRYSLNNEPEITVAGDTALVTLATEGIHTLRFHAVDRALNAESPQSLTLRIDTTAPVALHEGPFAVDEGDSLILDGTASHDALSGVLTSEWSLDDDGVFDDGDPASFQALDGPARSDVALRVIDLAGNVTLASTEIEVRNLAPEITLDSASVVVDESQTAQNSGTFSDPGQDSVTLTASAGSIVGRGNGVWSWTLDTVEGPGDSQTIVITATDEDGAAASVEFPLTVENVAPAIVDLRPAASRCGDLVEGQAGEIFTVHFTDPGVLDSHTVVVDWGDGNPPQEFPVPLGERSVSAEHGYRNGGIYDVTVRVLDDDGGVSRPMSTLALVTGIGVRDGVLQIVGTEEDDHVTVNQQGNGLYKVHADFLPGGNLRTLPSEGIELIRMVLCAGDDHASIAGSIGIPAIVDGGAGNDHLNGGGGSNVILGGSGDDHVSGGGARDILIGGSGADRIVANGGEDILIGGSTSYDSDSGAGRLANDLALLDLLHTWNSEVDFATRVAALTRPDQPYRLVQEDTVFDDLELDSLTGAAGQDWILDGEGDVS